MMKSTMVALVEVSPEIPILILSPVLDEIDLQKCSSIDNAVKAMEDIIVLTADRLEISKSVVLAEVIKSCLFSTDDNPNHIYALELMSKCDQCFFSS